MIRREEILKNTPDYDQYTENEAILSIEEMRELGLMKCGGCCSRKNNDNNQCRGCQKSKKCCKSK